MSSCKEVNGVLLNIITGSVSTLTEIVVVVVNEVTFCKKRIDVNRILPVHLSFLFYIFSNDRGSGNGT